MVKATHPSRLRLAAALLLVLPFAAGTALAQLPTAPSVAVALDEAALSLGASNETTLSGTVTNGGRLQGTVALAPTIPAGWNVTLDPATPFTLAAGQSATFTVTLVAPAAGVGAAAGDVFVDATLTDGAGQTATAQAALAVTRVDPVIPPTPPPYDLYASYALLAAGAVGIAFLVYAQLRGERLARERARAEEEARRLAHEAYLARETGIGLTLVDGPVHYGTRREVVYRLAVENQTPRDRVALVGVAEVPHGWTAASSLPRIPLKPSERIVVTFYVAAGDGVPTGAIGRVSFFAKPEEAQELDQRVSVEVPAPAVRVPTLGDRPATAPREAVAPKPVLRK